MKRKPVKTVIQKLKDKGYKIFTGVDEIIAEIEDVSPFHSESGDKPAKKNKKHKKSKKKRVKVNVFAKNAEKFF